jgi:hypothetical protein
MFTPDEPRPLCVPTTGVLTRLTLLVAALHIGSGVAHGQVPTVADIAACNEEARLGVGAATPTTKDLAGADAARRAAADTATVLGAPGMGAAPSATQSPDPQIQGMDGRGAADAMYRATYRVCMRRSGF